MTMADLFAWCCKCCWTTYATHTELLLSGNSNALGAFLYGAAYLNNASTSAVVQNLTDTLSALQLPHQATNDVFYNAILQSLQQPAGIASPNVTATLVAAAAAAGAESEVAAAFLQVTSLSACFKTAHVCTPCDAAPPVGAALVSLGDCRIVHSTAAPSSVGDCISPASSPCINQGQLVCHARHHAYVYVSNGLQVNQPPSCQQWLFGSTAKPRYCFVASKACGPVDIQNALTNTVHHACCNLQPSCHIACT